MGFNLVEYGKLKSSLIESIRTEIKSHDSKKDLSVEKLFKSAQCLSDVRRIQVQFILTAINVLDTYPASTNDECVEKARILNTLAFCVHEEIVKSYDGAFSSMILSADRSTFKKALSASLDLRVGNMPGLTDLYDMYPSLIEFLKTSLYVEGDVRRGYLHAREQKFSINGLSVKVYIDELCKKHGDNYQQLSDLAEQKNKKLQASAGYWRMFGSSADSSSSASSSRPASSSSSSSSGSATSTKSDLASEHAKEHDAAVSSPGIM